MKSYFNLDVTFQVEDISIGPLLVERFLKEIGVRQVQSLHTRYSLEDGRYGNVGAGCAIGNAPQATSALPEASSAETAKDAATPAAPAPKPRKPKDAPPAQADAGEAAQSAATPPPPPPAETPASVKVDLAAKIVEMRALGAEIIKGDSSKRKAVQDIVLKFSANKTDPAISAIPAESIQAAIDEARALAPKAAS